MSHAQFKLTGFNAVIALIAVIGFAGFRFISATSSIETAAAEELTFWLRSEYTSEYLTDDLVPDEAMAQQLLALDDIRFREMSARGTTDDLVVRVEIAVDGAPPPFGDEVRYFRMEYSLLTQWRLNRETTKWSYYLKLF
jgi:hypothetical protein